MQAQRGGDEASVQHPTLLIVPPHTPCALRGWQQAADRHVIISESTGWALFLSAPSEIGRG